MIIWKDSSYYQPNILVNKQNINKINKNEKTKHKTKATEEIIGEYGYKKKFRHNQRSNISEGPLLKENNWYQENYNCVSLRKFWN